MANLLSKPMQIAIINEAFNVPMGGNFPAIDIAAISALLSETFHLDSLTINHESSSWEASLSIEKKTYDMQEVSSPLFPSFWIAIPKESKSALSTQFLQEDTLSLSFYDQELQDNFYLFILAEAIKTLQNQSNWGLLSLHLGTATPQFKDHLNITLSVQTASTTIPFHILIPQPSFAGIERLYESVPEDIISRVPQDFYVPVSITQGQVFLSKDELSSLNTGDFVRIDKNENFANMMINGMKLGDVFKEDKTITITEFNPILEGKMDEEEKKLDEIFDETTTEEEADSTEESIPLETIDSITYTVHVELGRMKTPLKELIQWKIGNQFTIPIQDPNKVHLCVNGTRIAQGELIQLEECIGVKITEKK